MFSNYNDFFERFYQERKCFSYRYVRQPAFKKNLKFKKKNDLLEIISLKLLF